MTESITYSYRQASVVEKGIGEDQLFLSKYSEMEKGDSTCFFWGKLTEPFIVSRCLIILSNIVQSSFNLSPFQMALLKDPIVTAGNEKIRFEGFSHCAGAYGRVDILPEGHDGEFIENGTTNVDFNSAMISALSKIRKSEQVVLSVGKKEIGIHKEGKEVIERKVPLPVKWIKGLTTVQLFLADSIETHAFSRIQAIQLFRTLPKGNTKIDHYLIERGGRPAFSPMKSHNAICIGGVHRLRLIEPLIPLIDQLKIFPHNDLQSTTWQLYFGAVRFTFSLSRDHWRGFSGEGAALESLLEDVPDNWLKALEGYSYANQSFNPSLLGVEHSLDPALISNLTGRLSALGLLGYDLDERTFFHRRLPFKTERILGLNPRLKNALKLVEEGQVQILSKKGNYVEARVAGSGVNHTVIISGENVKCTCVWYSRHQGERGPCKHILATKKVLS